MAGITCGLNKGKCKNPENNGTASASKKSKQILTKLLAYLYNSKVILGACIVIFLQTEVIIGISEIGFAQNNDL